MDLLTLLPYLEPYCRSVVATKTTVDNAISWRRISSVTINTEDVYTNVNQICVLHNGDDLYLYVNHTTRRNRAKYKLADITTIAIT